MVGISGIHDLRVDDHEHAGGSLPLFENRLSAAELRRCSSIIYVDDDTDTDTDIPLTLLFHGSEDLVTVPDQSARSVDALEGAGTQVGCDAVGATGHIFLHSSYHYPAI